MLDTNVALALFAFRDPDCLNLAAALHARTLQAVANSATLDEWRCVLRRAELGLDTPTRTRAAEAFEAWVSVVTNDLPLQPAPMDLPRCRDPDDQIFLELARDAGAIALYSRDRELLKLSRRTQRISGFPVVRPEDFRGNDCAELPSPSVR